MIRIKLGNYGDYANAYSGPSWWVSINDIKLFYSYETIVAYRNNEEGLVVSENVWSRTTGKHLNWIDPYKEHRVDADEFRRRLNNLLNRYELKEKGLIERYNESIA